MITRLTEILGARWLIEGEEIPRYIPLFVSFLNGNKFVQDDFADTHTVQAYAVNGNQGALVDQFSLADSSIPANSVAVIPIQGTILSWKTIDLINNIRLAEANPNISSILFLVNSPGGMVFMTDIAAKVIADTTLPTVAYVMNKAASAAMWLVSACDVIMVSSPLDMLGSVGTFTSYTDFTGMMKEKLGISVYDLYATKSVRKNENIRSLVAGNNQPLLNELDFVNETFHQAIMANLGIPADSEVFTGALYNAKDAIRMGLADEIAPVEQAVSRAFHMGLVNQYISNQKTQ